MPICLKCQNSFPNRKEFQGKFRNLQRRKFCLDCSPFGSRNTSSLLNGISSSKFKTCTSCLKELPLDRKHFYFNKQSKNEYTSHCIPCRNKITQERAERLKTLCIQHLGGKCVRCSYSKCSKALEFHHTNPNQKEFSISERRTYSFNILKKELEKCILLCSNCHREEHDTK